MECPFCKGDKWKKAPTDLGFAHFKAEKMKPIRMSVQRCEGCGFVALFANKDQPEKGVFK